MTKVVVVPGACGFTAAISAEMTQGESVVISVDSGCPMVRKMATEIARLGLRTHWRGFWRTRSTWPRGST